MNKYLYSLTLKVLAFILYIGMIGMAGCSDDTTPQVPSHPDSPEPTPTSGVFPDSVDTAMVFSEDFWRNPPMEFRPYVRWWWPGGSVVTSQLDHEISSLAEHGFGGVEIQPVLLGLTPEEIVTDPEIRTVGTYEFFNKVLIAAEKSLIAGLGFDITMGSGWSTGVPDAEDAAEKQLLMANLRITGPRDYNSPLPVPDPPAYRKRVNVIMNAVGPFDENLDLVAVTAARILDGAANTPVLDSFIDISEFAANGYLIWDIPEGEWMVFAFYQNNTSHAPAGAAYPGRWFDALIVDHLDSSGAGKLIDNYANPLLKALGDNPPDTIFIDSFEMIGELPWTTQFLDRFQELKGYDLSPFLPLMFMIDGESKYTQITDLMAGYGLRPTYFSSDDTGIRVREDYEEVRGILFLEGFFVPMIEWGHENGVEMRMQAQGGWADYLDAFQLADIPESEALFALGAFDFLKLASSAAHVCGSKWVGSESFITLSPDPESITLEDFYRLGNKALSAGINRIIYHGFPYGYVRENGEKWYPLSGEGGTVRVGPVSFTSWISEDHPEWPNLKAFNEYLSRLSYALSCGSHQADIAWLYPEWEYPDNVMGTDEESPISRSLRQSGFVYDRISRRNLEGATLLDDQFVIGEAEYPTLVINDLEVASPEMMTAIEKLVDAGIPVLVKGDLPDRAYGFADYQHRDEEVKKIIERMQDRITFVQNESEFGVRLSDMGIEPALTPTDGSQLVFMPECRSTAQGYILALFNESDDIQTQTIDVRIPAQTIQVLDPQTGDIVGQATSDQSGNLSIEITIDAHRSVVLLAD